MLSANWARGLALLRRPVLATRMAAPHPNRLQPPPPVRRHLFFSLRSVGISRNRGLKVLKEASAIQIEDVSGGT